MSDITLPVPQGDLTALAKIGQPAIDGADAAANAADVITMAASIRKALAAFLKEAKVPFKRQIDRIDAAVKPHMDRAALVEQTYKAALVSFRQAESRRLLEEAEREQARQIEEQAAIAEELKADGMDPEAAERAALVEVREVAGPIQFEAPKVAVGEVGMVRVVKAPWTYEVVDPAAIPSAFLEPSHAKIMAAIRGGQHVIPGLRVYQPETVRTA